MANTTVPPIPCMKLLPALIEYSHETAPLERTIVKVLLFVVPSGNAIVGGSGRALSTIISLLLFVVVEVLPKSSLFLTCIWSSVYVPSINSNDVPCPLVNDTPESTENSY